MKIINYGDNKEFIKKRGEGKEIQSPRVELKKKKMLNQRFTCRASKLNCTSRTITITINKAPETTRLYKIEPSQFAESYVVIM